MKLSHIYNVTCEMNRELNKKTGNLGESLSCKYLENKGFFIVERNYTKKFGEIDIIAEKGKEIHFIEVKSVSCENLNEIALLENKPEEKVTHEKQHKITKVAESYIKERVIEDKTILIDIFTVFIDKTAKKAIIRPLWNTVFT